MKRKAQYGPGYFALAGLWGGATLTSMYLVMNYSLGIPVETVALYFMAVPLSLALSLYFLARGLHHTISHARKVSISDIVRERIE